MIPVFPPDRTTIAAAGDGSTGIRSTVKRQTLAFSATLRGASQGNQNDAMSAEKRNSGPDSEERVMKAAVPEPGGFGPGRKADKGEETIPIPDGVLTSISGEQTDAISSHLAFHSTITQEGPPPAGLFGQTHYSFEFKSEKFSVAHRAGTPGTPGGPGATGTPATPPTYEVTGNIPCKITFQVAAQGRTNIASDADPSITQTNYPAVVSDLTPAPAAVNQGGLSLVKNQPPRRQFWADDLTIKHERFHCAEDQRFGAQGVQLAQDWLNTRVARNPTELFALLGELPSRVGNVVSTGMASPADEERAYADGAPEYLARAQAIRRKGDASGYVPKPPAPAPHTPGSQPGARPQAPVHQPAPASKESPSK